VTPSRCDICGLEHDRRLHLAGAIGQLRLSELRADQERRRRSKVAAAKLAADRIRARELRPRPTPKPATTPVAAMGTCASCRTHPRRKPLPWCEPCALAQGCVRCGACGALAEASKVSNAKCSACRAKKTTRLSAKKKCAECALSAIKGSRWCHKCSLRNGWKVCSTCSKPFEPLKKQPRRRRCPKCVDKFALAGPYGSGSSVRTVSGGLPGLSRR
jgi:hypothetical protein